MRNYVFNYQTHLLFILLLT